MNILVVDTINAGLFFCMKCLAAGHKVRYFQTKDKRTGLRVPTGDGIVQRVEEWEPSAKWADLIVFTDNAYFMRDVDRLREKGFPVFSGGSLGASWELDRQKGLDVMERAGIKTIEGEEFNNYDDAIKYVIETGGRYVSKPSGDADKALTYVSQNASDMLFMLEYWKKHQKQKQPFILQKYVKGIEMAVGGWFGPHGFSRFWCENWEFKKLMNGELGVNTGEMGTILRYTKESKLADYFLKPIEGMLHGINYVGYVDMNARIDEQGNCWPMEWTMRFGWPIFNIQQFMHRGDPAEWMRNLIDGFDSLQVSQEVACGVVVAIPDFPYDKRPMEQLEGFPLYGVEVEDAVSQVALSRCKLGTGPCVEDGKVRKEQMFVTAGTDIATVMGKGATVEKARERAYREVKKIQMPNSMLYRTDIGERLKDQLPKLQAHGLATDMEYD